MNNYSITLPNYTIGEKAYSAIDRFCSAFGAKAVMIGGKTAMEKASGKILKNCRAVKVTARIWYGGECCDENVEILSGSSAVSEADMIFAVGGGKALDTGKRLADKLGKPVFTFPTIASNCSCCTCVSIMYKPDGEFSEPYFSENSPVHAFIDTQIMSCAPEKYLRAGMGDTYALFYESQISARGGSPEHFKGMGLAIANMCAEPIFRNGAKAYCDNKKHICSEEFKETVLAVTVSAGLASVMLTRDRASGCGSGLAHAFTSALTSAGQAKERLHGETVALGVLACLLYDGQADEYMRVREFNEKVSLPIILRDIGVAEEQAERLAETICRMPDIRHYPYKPEPEMLKKVLDMLV